MYLQFTNYKIYKLNKKFNCVSFCFLNGKRVFSVNSHSCMQSFLFDFCLLVLGNGLHFFKLVSYPLKSTGKSLAKNSFQIFVLKILVNRNGGDYYACKQK